MLPIKYMTMRERWQKSGCMISNREVIMEKTVKILRSEISELVIKVQRFYALETVKKILEVNPERIEEFGLKKKTSQIWIMKSEELTKNVVIGGKIYHISTIYLKVIHSVYGIRKEL